ncbi:hypothetical protein PsYK624_025700 [Phanerochaete sordida]|uniref:Carbohydrate-binding module family 19 domain-containing protein n=1 Tax=Phanerochaete sordida TaxID=48140 RepID=A0A9P3G2I6_9APHY|nr:hypothetical protein PsYK624_025700 [Phanerochaete sordida]
MFSLTHLLLATLTLGYAVAAPALNSASYQQNAVDAQILNTEFRGVNETDPCNSGQTACVGGGVAVCKYGSWNVTSCDQSNACYAVPSTSGSGTILTCTTEQSALNVFESAGLQGLYSNGTDTRAFPTVPPSISTSLSATSASPTSSQSSDVDVVTVTVTLPPPTFSTTLPTEVRTIDPSEAASILSSLSAQGATVAPVPSSAPSPTQAVGDCHRTTTDMSATTSTVTSMSSATSPAPLHGYYHKARAARRA